MTDQPTREAVESTACPFCGCTGAVLRPEQGPGLHALRDEDFSYMHCQACGADGPVTTPEAALAMWDTRTPPATPEPAGDVVEAESVDDLWLELNERDDRTSPEEYPEMCLINYDEFCDFIARAHGSSAPPAEVVPVCERCAKPSPQGIRCFSCLAGEIEQLRFEADRCSAQRDDTLPADVRRLVISARIATDAGADDSEARELLSAVEAFSSRVPYEDEPAILATSPAPPADRGVVEAVAAERERCARVAYDEGVVLRAQGSLDGDPRFVAAAETAFGIAAAIRQPTASDEGKG